MTEVRDAGGTVAMQWWLLTNDPAEWEAAEVACWYDFRWRMEREFQRHKSTGWDVWGGGGRGRTVAETAGGVGRCRQVWRSQARSDASAEWRTELLLRLSGRQVKRSQPVTTSGRLAGLWVWHTR